MDLKTHRDKQDTLFSSVSRSVTQKTCERERETVRERERERRERGGGKETRRRKIEIDFREI